MKPAEQQTNMKTLRWKLPEFRKSFMKQCLEGVNQSGLPSTCLSGLVRQLERYELKLNGAADNEAEYCHCLSEKTKELFSQLRNAESKPCLSNSNASREVFSAQETGKSANIDWKEQVYQEIQRMNSAYFSKVHVSYHQMNRALQQLGSSPQGSNANVLEKLRKTMKRIEVVLALFRLKKCQITTDTKKILDEAEKFIQTNFFSKNVSSNHQGLKHLADEQSRQQSGPSHSSISPLKIIETKQSQQALGTQNYDIWKDVSQQNKTCLKEQQVKKMETKPLSQALGTQNSHIWKDVSQENKPCLKEQQVKIMETKPLPQALGTQNSHMWKDVSQQNRSCLKEQQVKIMETKPWLQALGTQNYHIRKDVSQENKPCLKEQQVKKMETKPSPQAFGIQNSRIWKDVSQEIKPCLKEQQVKIMETKPLPQALGTQNSHIWKDVSQQNKLCLKEQQVKIIETKPSPQPLGTQYSHIWKDVSQQNKPCLKEQQVKIIETKPSPQPLGTQNSHIWKDVSQQNKSCLKEQQVKIIETKPSPQPLGTQNSHIWKDVSQQNKPCLKEQQVKIIETKPSLQPLGTRNSHIWKDVSQQNMPCLKEQQVKIMETEPSPQALGTRNYHTWKDVSQQNKICLKEQQVEKRYTNSSQHVYQVSINEGPDNAEHKQAQGSGKASEAFSVSVNSPGISASPLTENCNKLKEISHKSNLTFDEPSAEMKHILKVLAVISPEALSASVSEIREAVYWNDVPPTSEFLNGPPKMVQQQNQPGLIAQTGKSLASDIEQFSQARYVTCHGFLPTGRKRSHSMKIDQLSDAEEPDWTSVAYEKKKPRIVENSSLLEEIKEINNRLVDSVIVVGENYSFLDAPGVAAEDSEGLVIEFLFNAATVNKNLVSHISSDKKSIVKPLRLFVPTDYPTSSPVIVDKEMSEVSTEGQKDLSTIAKSKLRYSLRCLDQTWSLEDIAMLWEHCARETLIECAKAFGGGTFSSIYGGWKNCQNEV